MSEQSPQLSTEYLGPPLYDAIMQAMWDIPSFPTKMAGFQIPSKLSSTPLISLGESSSITVVTDLTEYDILIVPPHSRLVFSVVTDRIAVGLLGDGATICAPTSTSIKIGNRGKDSSVITYEDPLHTFHKRNALVNGTYRSIFQDRRHIQTVLAKSEESPHITKKAHLERIRNTLAANKTHYFDLWNKLLKHKDIILEVITEDGQTKIRPKRPRPVLYVPGADYEAAS